MPIRPSIRLNALPLALPLAARLRIARDAGFEGVEVEAGEAPAPELRAAAAQARVAIHSVYCVANRALPLSSGDPATRDAGIAATLAALEAAAALGADTMLLVPGMVNEDTTYDQAYRRSQDVLRSFILPAAERLGVAVAIENVWNGFHLSPYECARYLDELASPFARFYLDVGNLPFGRPEGWIEILDKRIVKLHLKDFLFWPSQGRFAKAPVGAGHIGWTAVRAALRRIGFSGWAVMAEAEQVQPRFARLAFLGTRRLAGRLGWNPASRAIETMLARRLADDAIDRFRRYVARPD